MITEPIDDQRMRQRMVMRDMDTAEKPVSVLVVDDSYAVRANFKCLLESKGYRMLAAATPGEALQLLEREVPQIVVTDLHMPRVNGLDFVDWLRSSHPYTTVIVLSGENSREKMRDALRRGVWDYLKKPLRQEELVESVEGAFAQARLLSGRGAQRARAAAAVACPGMGCAATGVLAASGETYAQVVHAYDVTVAGWARALELHDGWGTGHNGRVTELTLGMARALDMEEDLLVHLRWGALLHDVGNLGVSDRILMKPGQLGHDEYAAMKRHPEIAFDLLSPIEFLRPAMEIPYCHHERWDGTGYPRGLKGEEIPLCARIVAVADVWDSLLSDRPQRAAWKAEMARAEIASRSGSHFDPQVVQVFQQVYAPDPAERWRCPPCHV